jgi:hypothetical protein
MQNYVVRIYRASLGNLDSISGLIEDIESGQKEPFHSFSELKTLLAKSIGRGELALPNLTDPTVMYENIIAEVA